MVTVLQEKGMWVEALKSCREYLPAKLEEVQAEYDRECGARVTRDINSLFAQASQWEQNGEFKTAVDCLLKVCNIIYSTKSLNINYYCVTLYSGMGGWCCKLHCSWQNGRVRRFHFH